MKANELRIGNTTFEYNQDDNEFIVSNVSCWDFEKARLNNNETEFENRKPIPLTEEWLLKFGFEKGSNIIGDCYYIERDFGVSDFVLNITKTSNFDVYELDLKIDYVHQLQNLYFALTGEELIVKV